MKNFQCPNCPQSFWDSEEFTFHRIIKHGDEINDKNPNLVTGSEYYNLHKGRGRGYWQR